MICGCAPSIIGICGFIVKSLVKFYFVFNNWN